MIRALAVPFVSLAVAAPVAAQPGNLPLAPGVHQGSSIGPGTQFLPQPTPRFAPGGGAMNGGFGFRPKPYFAPGPFVPGFSPYFGFGLGGGLPAQIVVPPVVVQVNPPAAPAPPARDVVLVNEFPATLTVQFPAPADVWLNGEKVPGEAAEERVLTSPTLRPGQPFTFDLKARWTAGGKTYESARAVTLSAGDRSRLFVVSGIEVK